MMTMLTCCTILYRPLGEDNKNIFLCLLHVCEGNGASGMSPINAAGENKIALITPYSEDPGVGAVGRAHEHLQPDKSSYAHGRVEHVCLRKNDED